jgi:hypothetical protein
MLDGSLIQAIQKSQNRDRLLYLFFAGISFCVALFFLAGFVFGAEDFPPDKRPNLLIIAGVFCLMGGYLLFYTFKLQVDAVQLLTRSPHKIVWVYLQVRKGTSYAAAIEFQFVRFGLINKKQFGVRLSPQVCDALLQQMPSLVPHATLGYSPEIKQAFNRNPTSLLHDQHS